MLDNGVVVCHLARVIQERAKQVIDIGSVKGVSFDLYSESVEFRTHVTGYIKIVASGTVG